MKGLVLIQNTRANNLEYFLPQWGPISQGSDGLKAFFKMPLPKETWLLWAWLTHIIVLFYSVNASTYQVSYLEAIAIWKGCGCFLCRRKWLKAFLEYPLHRHVAVGGGSAHKGKLRSLTFGHLLFNKDAHLWPQEGPGEHLFPWWIQIVNYDQYMGNESVSETITDHGFIFVWIKNKFEKNWV